MAGKGRKKKDVFEDLDPAFKDAVAQSSPEDVMKKMAEVALAEEENKKVRDEDPDLAQAREALKLAASDYRSNSKANNLKLKYARQVLEDKGKV